MQVSRPKIPTALGFRLSSLGALRHYPRAWQGLVMVEMRKKSRLVPAKPESSFSALADIVRLCRLSC